MIFEHLLHRRKVSLLAFRALEGRERERTERHVASCAPCQAELRSLTAFHEALLADPVRTAEPELPFETLAARVDARISETLRSPRPAWTWRLGVGLPMAAAALLAIALGVPAILSRLVPGGGGIDPTSDVSPAAPSAAQEALAVSPEALSRLERNVAREQTARYLSEAGDVLVAVAATPTDCDRQSERVDVGQASARSRELLARRALLLDSGPQAVASAGPVLDDVELALREVASLEACVRRRDVQRFREDVERRQLLMRIRLMTRELEG